MPEIRKVEVEVKGKVRKKLPEKVIEVDLDAGVATVTREGVRDGVAFKEVYFTSLTPDGEFVDDEGVRWRVAEK